MKYYSSPAELKSLSKFPSSAIHFSKSGESIAGIGSVLTITGARGELNVAPESLNAKKQSP